MTKRFELKANFINGHAEIIDWVESEQKDAICIFNDLGVLPFSSAPSVCNLLNQLNDENEQLKEDLKRCRAWINSDKYDYELTLAFIKNKGYSLKDVLEYEKELKTND